MKLCQGCCHFVGPDADGGFCCRECGSEHFFETNSISRKKVTNYLKGNGWVLSYSVEFMSGTGEIWKKKGYEYGFAPLWPNSPNGDSLLLLEDQSRMAIFKVADSEGIPYQSAAEKIETCG